MKLSVLLIFLFPFYSQGSEIRESIDQYFGCPSSSFQCQMLNENMKRDSNRCRVSPSSIPQLERYMSSQNPNQKDFGISGRLRYFGPVQGRYFYTVKSLDQRKLQVHVVVHFRNLNKYLPWEQRLLQDKFDRAALLWTRNNQFGGDFEFKFSASAKKSKGSISVNLIRPYTRGPYFTEWSLGWPVSTIAHEFGHVMGLRDEYKYFKDGNGHADCDSSSLMCSSWGRPQAYHYFLLLQRVFCEV